MAIRSRSRGQKANGNKVERHFCVKGSQVDTLWDYGGGMHVGCRDAEQGH